MNSMTSVSLAWFGKVASRGDFVDKNAGTAKTVNVAGTLTGADAGNYALQNTTARKLGPGDIQIIPPGLGHRWQNIDAGGIQYLVFRVDPEKVLQIE